MKTLLSLAMAIICTNTFAQSFGRIEDKDRYVNVRMNPALKSEVIDKISDGEIILYDEVPGDWIAVPSKNKKYPSGYVHKSRVKNFKGFSNIPVKTILANSVVFQSGKITIEIATQPFNQAANKIEYVTEGEHKRVSKVNGLEPWGIFYNMPKVEYKSIDLSFGGKKIALPKESIANLYQPNLNQTRIYLDSVKNILYILAANSDGAGGYHALWIIKNEKYEARKLFGPL